MLDRRPCPKCLGSGAIPEIVGNSADRDNQPTETVALLLYCDLCRGDGFISSELTEP